jgi:hypothetical protein
MYRMTGWLDSRLHLDLSFVRGSKDGNLARKNDDFSNIKVITFEKFDQLVLCFDENFCRVIGKDNKMIHRGKSFCWVLMYR